MSGRAICVSVLECVCVCVKEERKNLKSSMNIKVVMKWKQLWKRGFHQKPLMTVIWDRPTMILSLYVHWNVYIAQSVDDDFSKANEILVHLILNALSFRLSPFKWALWAMIIFAKRVAFAFWNHLSIHFSCFRLWNVVLSLPTGQFAVWSKRRKIDQFPNWHTQEMRHK